MSASGSNRRPKPQPALSGGPPKPPKKTARGLENDGGPQREDLARRLLDKYQELAGPNLSNDFRVKVKREISKLKEEIRKEYLGI